MKTPTAAPVTAATTSDGASERLDRARAHARERRTRSEASVTLHRVYRHAGGEVAGSTAACDALLRSLFECPGKVTRVSDATTKVGGKKLGAGFAYIAWGDETTSWQLLRPGYYGQHRAAGWRIPADDEDASLDAEFEFEDADSDDSGDDSDKESDDMHLSDDSDD